MQGQAISNGTNEPLYRNIVFLSLNFNASKQFETDDD